MFAIQLDIFKSNSITTISNDHNTSVITIIISLIYYKAEVNCKFISAPVRSSTNNTSDRLESLLRSTCQTQPTRQSTQA